MTINCNRLAYRWKSNNSFNIVTIILLCCIITLVHSSDHMDNVHHSQSLTQKRSSSFKPLNQRWPMFQIRPATVNMLSGYDHSWGKDIGDSITIGEVAISSYDMKDDDDTSMKVGGNLLTKQRHSHVTNVLPSLLKLRGGEEEEDEYDEDEEDVDEEEEEEVMSDGMDYVAILEQVVDVTKTKVVPVVIEVSKKTAEIVQKVTISTYRAIQRAISAALEGEDVEEEFATMKEDDDEDEIDSFYDVDTMFGTAIKFATKTLKLIKRMVKAALTFPEFEEELIVDDDDDEDMEGDESPDVETEVETFEVETKVKATVKAKVNKDAIQDDEVDSADKKEEETPSDDSDKGTSTLSLQSDFGTYLAETYGVNDDRDDSLVIMGGSFQDALESARKQARLLLVFIPSQNPKGKKISFFGGGNKADKGTIVTDKQAIESLLSKNVAKAANKKSRKNYETPGSFAVWGAKAGSSDATSALNKLNIKTTNSKGEKRPTLCIVYPAYVSGKDERNLPKIVPTLLAQHHCNPPPGPDVMAVWMNTFRKRHRSQYQKMQKELQEIQIAKERVSGYKESVVSDTERKIREAKEKAEQEAKAKAEAERQEEIAARRKALKDSLPDDAKGGNVKKIALRFFDGRKGQRGFSPDEPLRTLFNWVDALFEVERETVVLTTMNGQKTFSWDDEGISDTTLEDAGLGKMTAFRVTVKKEDEEMGSPKQKEVSS